MRVAGLLTGLLLVAGCGDAPAPLETAPRLTAVEEATFGDAEGPGALSGVFDLAVSASGRVFASEPELGRVVAFEADGSFAGEVGSRGSGPGELRVPSRLGWKGDTLAVLDFGRGVALLGRDGKPLGRIRFQRAYRDRAFPFQPFVPLPDGTVAAAAPVSTGMVADGAVTTEDWIRADRSGRTLDTLLLRDLRGSAFRLQLGERRVAASHPLPFDPLWVASPDGSSFVLVDRIPLPGDPPRFRVTRVGASGDTVAQASLPYAPVPLDAPARDSIARVAAEGWAQRLGTTREALASEIESQLSWPPHRPPVTAAVAGGDGTVWLRREAPARDSVRWDVLDARLRPLGHLLLPEGLEVKAATSASLHGVVLDRWDVPTIVRYRVAPAAGPPG